MTTQKIANMDVEALLALRQKLDAQLQRRMVEVARDLRRLGVPMRAVTSLEDRKKRKLRTGTKKQRLISALKQRPLTRAEASELLYKKPDKIGAVDRVLVGIRMAVNEGQIPGYMLEKYKNKNGERTFRLVPL